MLKEGKINGGWIEMEDINFEREIEILKGSLPDDMSKEVKDELYEDLDNKGFCSYGEKYVKRYYRRNTLTGEKDYGGD